MEARLFHRVPDLALVGLEGEEVKLASFQGRYLVLYFFPKANTPGCTREAQDFSRLFPEFERYDAQVVGVSRDKPETQAKFKQSKGLSVTLLSDPEGEVAGAFGAVKKTGGIQRSTFIIDRVGVVRQVWPKVKVDGHAEEVLLSLKNLYQADQELNPAIELRRARRALSERPVSEELVERLLAAAHLAPSCANNQPWRFVVARGESLAALKESLSGGNYWAKAAPVIIAVFSRKELDCQLSDGRDYFLFDTGLAVGNLLVQATQMGLIAHPIAGYDPLKAKAALKIPDDHVLITLIVVGWPGASDKLSEKHRQAETAPRDRLPLENVAHWDTFSPDSGGKVR